MLHYAFGYSACALVIFRIIWGVVGTRYARFSQFVKGPAAIAHHLKSLLSSKDSTGIAGNLGHNPVGALAMLALLLLVLLIGVTGFWSVKGLHGEW